MVWVAGADGCRKGWFRACRETDTGELWFHLVEAAADLLRRPPRPGIVALDIPIGLTEAGPRACDRAARERLGWPRRSSVFPAPIRPALGSTTREEASRITAARDGRQVGTQAWALYGKIREVDALLRTQRDPRRRIREVHPEVSFWAWAGGRAMAAGKRTAAGRRERERLIEAWLGPGRLVEAREAHAKRDLAEDDVLDALAALWTATRIAAGRARTLPEQPTHDATGLRMEIVY